MATRTRPRSAGSRKPVQALDEARFLARYDASRFERPSVAVDVVALTVEHGALRVLVIERREHPFRGTVTLPGGFVRLDESLDAAAERVLREKAGLGSVFLEQLYTFGEVRRDPRTRVIAVAYYALVDAARFPRTDAERRRTSARVRVRVPWAGETGGAVDLVDDDGRALSVGFDHASIAGMAVKRLRGKLDYAPVGFQLLSSEFTLLELQRVHEAILGRELNKDSFRRRMLASGQLEATGRHQSDVGHRPAELYRFRQRSAV